MRTDFGDIAAHVNVDGASPPAHGEFERVPSFDEVRVEAQFATVECHPRRAEDGGLPESTACRGVDSRARLRPRTEIERGGAIEIGARDSATTESRGHGG